MISTAFIVVTWLVRVAAVVMTVPLIFGERVCLRRARVLSNISGEDHPQLDAGVVASVAALRGCRSVAITHARISCSITSNRQSNSREDPARSTAPSITKGQVQVGDDALATWGCIHRHSHHRCSRIRISY